MRKRYKGKYKYHMDISNTLKKHVDLDDKQSRQFTDSGSN